jgi:hypothetical protein
MPSRTVQSITSSHLALVGKKRKRGESLEKVEVDSSRISSGSMTETEDDSLVEKLGLDNPNSGIRLKPP